MRSLTFLLIFSILIAAVPLLSYVAIVLMREYPFLMLIFTMSVLDILNSYILLGVGFGLPIILTASLLGAVQLILLFTGNINPHYDKEGFFKVLDTLFHKI